MPSEKLQLVFVPAQAYALFEDDIIGSWYFRINRLHGLIVKWNNIKPPDTILQSGNDAAAIVNLNRVEETMFLSDVCVPDRSLLGQVFREHDPGAGTRVVTIDRKLNTFLNTTRVFENVVGVWVYRLNAVQESRRERNSRSPKLCEDPCIRIGWNVLWSVLVRLQLRSPGLTRNQS